MRKAFYEKMAALAGRDRDVHFLTANLGYKFFDDIRKKCPKQFLDVGVAEQNMIGLAAGMALCGKSVYCYSIIPFLTLRACEQVRMDVCYHNLNVKLVGMGAGFTYGQEGFTHFGIEDMAVMRSMPGMTVLVPDTIENAVRAAELSVNFEGPLYIRLGRAGIHGAGNKATLKTIGKAAVLRQGKDCALIAIGNMVAVAEQVAVSLAAKGISASVVNMHTLKPLDETAVRAYAKSHRFIFSLEEHSVQGGLGSAVAEVLAESGFSGKFKRIGIPEKLDPVIGDADFLWDHYGLSPVKVTDRVVKAITGD
jgi:transketolase